MIAFLDASALIYLVEGVYPFGDQVRDELARASKRHLDLTIALSRLSWLECRVRPMREGATEILASFDAFFSQPDLVWVELSRDIIELATAVRVTHNLRTPDALQAASCLQLGSKHRFVTGDPSFRKVSSLNVSLVA